MSNPTDTASGTTQDCCPQRALTPSPINGNCRTCSSFWRRWSVVVLYGAAMAWVEAAVVFYLRTLVGRIEPYQARPLPVADALGRAELVRELATLVMLFSVGWLAGRTWRSRLSFALIAFGVWDILYYAGLRILTGWPRSVLDWDILFLLPLPWWGPVLAPMAIATMMIIGGTLVSRFDTPERPCWPARRTVALSLAGALLALYVFMADALGVAGQGVEALRNLLPVWFNWPVFLVALALMATPIVDLIQRTRRPGHEPAG